MVIDYEHGLLINTTEGLFGKSNVALDHKTSIDNSPLKIISSVYMLCTGLDEASQELGGLRKRVRFLQESIANSQELSRH